MSTETVIESGLQVISKLIDRKPMADLDHDLFFNKLENSDVIEIKGTISTGMRLLLIKLIAKCILPQKYNGLDIDVLLINTENQLKVHHLFNILHKEIEDFHEPINIDKVVQEILNRLTIINCYNHNQLFLHLHSLSDLLLKNKQIGAIVVDSVSAYYWQQKDDLSYNAYVLRVIKMIRKVAVDFKVLTIYTKQYDFESKKLNTEWHEVNKIAHYKISLNKNENTNEFVCNVQSGSDEKKLCYLINETGFQWIQQKK